MDEAGTRPGPAPLEDPVNLGRGGTCAECGARLQDGWVACPLCGRARRGSASNERILRVLGKLGSALTEVSLLRMERRARKEDDPEQAEQLEIARRTVREVTPLLVDAVAESMAKSRHPPTKGGRPDRGASEGPRE